METKPSLEHTRLLIQERISYLKPYIEQLESSRTDIRSLGYFQQELAGQEQGLKAVNNHYELVEALKSMLHILGRGEDRVVDRRIYDAEELIKKIEG